MSSSEADVETQPSDTTETENNYEANVRKRIHDKSSVDERVEVKKTKLPSISYHQLQLLEYHNAVQSNDIIRIAASLKNGIDFDDDSTNDFPAIFRAISTSKVGDESLKYLIENGANLKVLQKDTGYTLLHTAAHCSDSTKFKILLDKLTNFDVNAKANNNVTPLHLAAWVGNIEIVKMLMERGADVDCVTEDLQLTPLHLAAMEYDVKDFYNIVMKIDSRSSLFVSQLQIMKLENRSLVPVIERLVENGADVNVRDKNKNTPLHYATLQSDKNVTGTLLKLGAYVDVMNVEGNLPLHNALKSFNVDVLTCLLEYGADINDISCQFKEIREYESSKANTFYNNVLEHTNKLRAADLPVAEVYKSEFHKSFWQSHRSECLREVERLATHMIVDNVSLYEFLHMNIRRRRAFIQHITLDLEMKFPKYYGIIYGSYRQAFIRRSLIELSKMVWDHLTEIDLPDVCFERIFFFLRNIDLTFFVGGAHDFLMDVKKKT